MRILVTGGCGFIGSNFVRRQLELHPDREIVNLDALTYAGNPANLADLADEPRYRFVHGDIADAATVEEAMDGCDAVVNFAAESHVDRSILDARPFLRTNVMGTHCLLEAARGRDIGAFVQISTDEVYGSLAPGEAAFTERTPLAPRNPYSASKAAADHIALAYAHTHGLPVCITRCCNNFGPWQFPEKLIPVMIHHALENRSLPVYGDGMHVRDWIYVVDHCDAVDAVLERGRPGEVYNIGSRSERPNVELVRTLLGILDRPEALIEHVPDRPGHDRRYAIDPTKIETELGWTSAHAFDEALRRTVEWYLAHPDWVEAIVTGEYRDYYRANYEDRA